MFFSADVADLVLYCVQQLGVMLAVGAETIVLIAYAVSMRDGKIDETEARFSRAVHRALAVGILCIVVSGIAITALAITVPALKQLNSVFEPVFLFKWLLIVILIAIYATQRKKPFSSPLIEGIIGGTWYVLFLVHILAPITSWGNLFILYGVLLGGFVAVWSAIVRIAGVKKIVPAQKREVPVPIRQKQEEKKIEKPAPPPMPMPIKIAQVPPLPPPTSVPPPVIKPVPPPAPVPPPVVKKEYIDDPHHSPWLPAIHFMPKNQAELEAKAHLMPLGAINPNS